MSIKNIYEVFDEFKSATTKQERLDVLRRNNSLALREVLIGAFANNIDFSYTKIPEYKVVEVPPGMSYNNMTGALSQVYLFMKNHPRRPEALTEKREQELLIQILESLEPREAEVYANMLLKDLKIPYLTAKLVNEAFPELPELQPGK